MQFSDEENFSLVQSENHGGPSHSGAQRKREAESSRLGSFLFDLRRLLPKEAGAPRKKIHSTYA